MDWRVRDALRFEIAPPKKSQRFLWGANFGHLRLVVAVQVRAKQGGGGNSGEGTAYHKTPPRKRFWTPPLMMRFPPPLLFTQCHSP